MNVEIYSKENCVFCTKAKYLLKNYNPKVFMLDDDFSREQFFQKFPDARTFPQIIIDGKHIGGYQEVEKWMAFNKPNEVF